MEPVDQFPHSTRWICPDASFQRQLARCHLDSLPALSSRAVGECITDHRSSWVRRWTHDSRSYYIKTYDYPTWRDRRRGIGRNTLFAKSRPRRERAALDWLREHGFGGPRVRAVVEGRQLGFLRRAVLVTDAWPGDSMASLLPSVDEARRMQLIDALKAFVHRLHRAGFRDRNLDLRNLLARSVGGIWEIAKIDSPRFRLVAPGSPTDALAHADWQRLERSLTEALSAAEQQPRDPA